MLEPSGKRQYKSTLQDPAYSELNALFAYNAMLVAINKDLAQCIVEIYKSNL